VPADAGEVWSELRDLWTGSPGPAAVTAARAPALRRPVLDSFLFGTAAKGTEVPESLGAGTRLDLRREAWNRVEVRSPDGVAIGWLPAEDAQVVAELLGTGALVTARVRAVVPAFRRSRVHLAVEVEAEGG
jgi:hypothetical protein